jgi:hypothetical protein
MIPLQSLGMHYVLSKFGDGAHLGEASSEHLMLPRCLAAWQHVNNQYRCQCKNSTWVLYAYNFLVYSAS